MSTQMSSKIMENMSIYIPHVFPNFTSEYIRNVFEEFVGRVHRVDLVTKMDKNNKMYNAAYIHFDHWYNTTFTENLQNRIHDPTQEARIVHDDPWHWILLENTAKKYVPGERKQRIQLNPDAKKYVPVISESNTGTNTYTVTDPKTIKAIDKNMAKIKAYLDAQEEEVEQQYIYYLENENKRLNSIQ